jgi:poly-gamma-glutamate synthesis protein (capsule biosynthesis protein)
MRLIESEGTPRLSIAALGDVGIVGSARARAAHEGYASLFRVPAGALRAADVGFANLEIPVGERAWVRDGRSPEFYQDAAVCAGLASSGVRVVSIATNHTMDCGPRGLERTLEACAQAGVLTAGAGANLAAARRPAQLEARGLRLVFLAYSQTTQDAAGPSTPGIAPLDEAMIREDIAEWRPRADILVASTHWGSMYVDYPPPRVTALARAIAECGADLVIGHHPHVVQGAERVGRTLVIYSLGDGAFNARAGDFHANVASQSRLSSGVFTARLTTGGAGLDVDLHRLDDDGIPTAVDTAEAENMIAHLRTISAGLADAPKRFAEEGASQLMKYEWEGLGHYARQGRVDKILKLVFSVRPRHLPIIWHALRRSARPR